MPKTINMISLISNDKFTTCSDDQTIKLFDINTFECIRIFFGHKHYVI
jgi:WD40 repeat protein